MKFPENPENGMIFEASAGMYFQYYTATNTWRRLEGFDNTQLATPNINGLMSKEDFLKLESLYVPPPKTTLTSDQCSATYSQGSIRITSSKNDLQINNSLTLLNNGSTQLQNYIIHEDVNGIDFSINVNRLLSLLEQNGNLTYRNTQGLTGDKGIKGPPGKDNLDTGPQGIDGANGQNASFQGVLEEDFTPINVSKLTRVIVDISNDPEDPHTLICKLGYVGNPNVCPSKVNWKPIKSSWVVAAGPSNGECSFGCVRASCQSNLYYIDFSDIQDAILAQYNVIINYVKSQKEALVKSWLDVMINYFNAQKQALCCAIESVQSAQTNQTIRDAWSNGRYQAAQGGYAFATETSGTLYPRANPQQSPADFFPPENQNIPSDQIVTLNVPLSGDPKDHTCSSCIAEVTLDGTNTGIGRSVKFELPEYSYVATIIQCCLNYSGIGSSGLFYLVFNNVDENGTIVPTTYQITNQGKLTSANAQSTYVGESIAFSHKGGQIKMYADSDLALSITGEIKICIQTVDCFEKCIPGGTGSTNITYENGLSCKMSASHLKFYQNQFQIDNSCKALVEIGGTKFMIVKVGFSAGTENNVCGFGEYPTTSCIKYFLEKTGQHIAVAYPTIDNMHFFGLPADPAAQVSLVYDRELSNAMLELIKGNAVSNGALIFEDGGQNMTLIVVPSSS